MTVLDTGVSSSQMKSGIICVNGVKTRIRSLGRWIEDKPTGQEDIVLIIPGNPGITQFYSQFAKTIYKKTGYTVWILGYSGHEVAEDIAPLKGNEDKYGLQGQVRHKMKFIEEYVPKDARLHVIGHSIGSYMTLKLLDSSLNSKIYKSYLIFPTFERMVETRNGKILTRLVAPIVWLIRFLSAIFTFFPTIIQRLLVQAYMIIERTPLQETTLEAIISLVDPTILGNIFFLAYEEMDQVKERDDAVFRKNLKKIRVLYGETDGWAPAAFCNRLKSDIPGVDCHLSNYEHAFVLRQSREVGNFVAEWLIETR